MTIMPLLLNNDGKINYAQVLTKYPWIGLKNQNYILSPDSDGFLCGLLVTSILDGQIAGFYDNKIALIKKGVHAKDCIFLDLDINRKHIKSVGHHLVTFNNSITHANHDYSNCIQPNVFRNFDGKKSFQRKYPFGTIHLLLGLMQEAGHIRTLKTDAIWPILFTDGVWNNLFGYTENCIDWIKHLHIDMPGHILNPMLCSSHHTFYEIMVGLDNFLRMRDTHNAKGYYDNGTYQEGGRNKRTGDKLKISNPKGQPINLVKTASYFEIHTEERARIENFIKALAGYTGWAYAPSKWTWADMRLMQFTKDDFSKSTLTNSSYTALLDKNPLSMAMTSGQDIEYTLEKPDTLC